MIKPTIGRVVLFNNNNRTGQRVPALICHVHSDTLINVGGFDQYGMPFSYVNVTLCADGEECLPYHAEWMPYQKEVARKEEEARAIKEQCVHGEGSNSVVNASIENPQKDLPYCGGHSAED